MSELNPDLNQKDGNGAKSADHEKQNDSAQGRELENQGGYESGSNQTVKTDLENQNWQGDKPHSIDDTRNEQHQWEQQTAGKKEADFDKARESWVRGDGNTDNVL